MKRKKIIIVLFCVLLAVAAGVGAAFMMGNKEELSLKENQRYVYAYITSIQGNEITYMEIEESVVTAMLEPETEADAEDVEEGAESEKQNAGRGESQSSGSRPNRGSSSQDGSSRGESFFGGQMQFGNMSETVTTYIPVGVVVHTASDVSTTFSRLASGDLIKILVESNASAEEIIEEIWMLQ